MFRHIRKLFISTKSDDTGPTVRAQYFIRLDTYKAVRPHPLDLSSEGGEAVEVAWLMGKIYRHDVGLIVQRTRQPAESDTSEEYITLLRLHLVDYHAALPFMAPDGDRH